VIEKICVKNFRCFKNLSLNMANMMVLIGRNGSGKSQFVDMFRFISEIMSEGVLDRAIRRRGGWTKIRHANSEGRAPVELSCQEKFGAKMVLESKNKKIRGPFRLTWRVRIRSAAGRALQTRLAEVEGEKTALVNLGDGAAEVITLSRERDKYHETIKLIDKDVRTGVVPPFARNRLRSPLILGPFGGGEWRFYDIGRHAPRQASDPSDWARLEREGSNMSSIIHRLVTARKGSTAWRILEDLYEQLRVVLRSDITFKTEIMEDGKVRWLLKEAGFRRPFSPDQVSDGTVRFIALFLALTWNIREDTVIFMEEPERSLHPSLFEIVVELIRKAASKVQVIVTTHSPEIVRYCLPEEVFLIDRIKDQSVIKPVVAKSEIDDFLKQDMRLDQMWLEGYLDEIVRETE